MKKIAGFFLFMLAIPFGLYFTSKLPTITGSIRMAFSGDAYDKGFFLGTIVYWMIHLTVMYFLIKYGTKWITEPRTKQRNTTG